MNIKCSIKLDGYTAWKWQFMLNKYNVWSFNSRIFFLLIMIVQRCWYFVNAIAYSMVGVYHAECKHWSLCPIFYVDTTTNENIPPKNYVLLFHFTL